MPFSQPTLSCTSILVVVFLCSLILPCSEVGGALAEFYDHCRPKLQDYDVNVRALIVGSNVMIGTQLNVVDLSKRHFLEYRNAVTLKVRINFCLIVSLFVSDRFSLSVDQCCLRYGPIRQYTAGGRRR